MRMNLRVGSVGLALAVAVGCWSCGGTANLPAVEPSSNPREPAQQDPFTYGDATVTFHVHGGSAIDQSVHVVLTAKKAGCGSIVAGSPAPGELSGAHTFPVGTTAVAVVDYYEGLFLAAGWKSGVDFVAVSSSIHLYAPTDVFAESDHEQLFVGTSVDPKRPG
jgi:hypothetical protein